MRKLLLLFYCRMNVSQIIFGDEGGLGRGGHHEQSPYMVNHVEAWQERLDTWPRGTMENLAKQLVADEEEGEKMIVAILS